MHRDSGAAAELGQHDIGGEAGRITGRGLAVSARRPICAGSRTSALCRQLATGFSEICHE